MAEQIVESPYNREMAEQAKEEVTVPKWLMDLCGENKILPSRGSGKIKVKKELFSLVQKRIDRAMLDIESALETLRQENRNV